MNEDRASRYHRLKHRVAILGAAGTGLLLTLLLISGVSVQLRKAAMAVGGGAVDGAATVALYVLLLSLAVALLSLPLACYDGFLVERRYGLSSESLAEFLVDYGKATAVTAVLAIAAAECVYAAMRGWPQGWWIVAALALACGMALVAGLAPVLLLPVFYRFKAIDRQELRERLTSLSRRAGLKVMGVYEWGLGAKTRRANAALVGSGPTRRLLLSDTLLAEYSDDEIEVILAHELGHHAHRDLLTSLALQALLGAAGLAAGATALEALWQPSGLASPSDVAGVPLLLLAAGAVNVCATPVVNLMARHHERRADRYALALTDRPAAFVSAMRRLGAQNLAEPNPSRLALWLFHTHPPVDQRISAARAFQRES